MPPCHRPTASQWAVFKGHWAWSHVPAANQWQQQDNYQAAPAMDRFDSCSSCGGKPGKMSRCLADLTFVICYESYERSGEKIQNHFLSWKVVLQPMMVPWAGSPMAGMSSGVTQGFFHLTQRVGVIRGWPLDQQCVLFFLGFIVIKMVQCRIFLMADSNCSLHCFGVGCHRNRTKRNLSPPQISAHCRSSQNSNFTEWTIL